MNRTNTDYAELCVASNYTFLNGASHPEELVVTAAALGLEAIAIADVNSVSGVVRAHTAAKQAGVQLVIGCRLQLSDGPDLLAYPKDRAAYGRLTRLLTLGKRRAPKGECEISLADVLTRGDELVIALMAPERIDPEFENAMHELSLRFKKDLYLAVSYDYFGGNEARLKTQADLAIQAGVKMLACNDVRFHNAQRRPLQDVLTCIREGCSVHEAGWRLAANAERHLKAPTEMARLFADYPNALTHSLEIARKCTFSLDELRYDYPVDPVPDGLPPQQQLVRLAWEGAHVRYPDGVPDKVVRQVEHELDLIEMLGFAPYFLTVHDIVQFAEGRGILCQGRGSAANSAVCYCLRITAVDPAHIDLLFERFISAERGEPPDIDVDFENARREEVIQYIYEKYGRERAGMTATVITYRSKSAIREVGKALGVTEDTIVALQSAAWRRSWDDIADDHIRDAGLDPTQPTIRRLMALAGLLRGFPRHLSQHTGGMVMTRGRLDEMVPIANAAMDARTVIEWDKNDLDALGILKVDILALGMLTCIHKAFDLLETHHGRTVNLATIPPEDPAVYDMLCDGDSVGVFQVESRAQMSMLPRLKPQNFYDLVIEVAIVRPGPIQGDMVHPYLRRRDGKEAVDFPSDALRQVLGKTLGIPLFQEQAMKIAIVAAGFSPEEADGLRRALATFRRLGDIHQFRERFIAGMLGNGYELDFSERCFKQIEGFADYGFPESHAASFALLVYVSAWLKRHYPAVFSCALLNSMPMGFYAAAQLVRDVRDHGIEVRPVDINQSLWDCTLENDALRLGFRQIKGLKQTDAEALVGARDLPYADAHDLQGRSNLGKATLERLARADAFAGMGLARRDALWAIRGLDDAPPPLFAAAGLDHTGREPRVALPDMALGEQVADDYRALSLSLKSHPVSLLRDDLGKRGCVPCGDLSHIPHGKRIRLAGLVTARQRPGSAKGVMFVTLEDETAHANLIVWPDVFETFRRQVLGAQLLEVAGEVQKEGKVIHVVSARLWDLTPWLRRLDTTQAETLSIRARNFH
ncbi:MAG: error-prone DNA polymerase [Rhodospirillaceae bacterium]|nr:error-prone DNA polymerase [Rhodospirillaceae bacterium]